MTDHARHSEDIRRFASDVGMDDIPERRSQPFRFPLARFDTIRPDGDVGYVIKGLFPREGLAVVWGAPKCGKSFFVSDALLHVALGWPYRGRRTAEGTVVYCALEGVSGFKRRIEAFRIAKLGDGDDPPAPFYLMPASLSLVADHRRFIAEIRQQLGAEKPVVVCIDTLNRSIAGSESHDEAMGAYIKAADAIRADFGCLVVIVHHSGHSAERPRGHSSLIGALDVQISVKRAADDSTVAELELAKDDAPGLTLASRLKVVELGVDQDGDPITSCVIEGIDGDSMLASPSPAKKLSASAKTALNALTKAMEEVGETAPASNHIPTGARVVTIDQWRTYSYRMGVSASDEARAKRLAFQRASEALLTTGTIGIWEPHVWMAR